MAKSKSTKGLMIPQDKLITISRRGSFDVSWKTHKAQCGAYGEHEMTYYVTIKGSEHECPKGWLLDNNDIPAYFAREYGQTREFKSCEAIASKAVDDFRAICARYQAKPSYIRVAVSGIADSEIACEWQRRTHLDRGQA